MDLQHPDITKIRKTGYTKPEKIVKEELYDFYGREIGSGDMYYKLGLEVIREDNLEQYLQDEYGMKVCIKKWPAITGQMKKTINLYYNTLRRN